MEKSALEKLKTEFHRGVKDYNHAKKTELDPDQLYEVLKARIPEDQLRHVGAALLNRWLETEKIPCADILCGNLIDQVTEEVR
jgi:hypothetical protein